MSRIALIALVAAIFLISSMVEVTEAQWGWPYSYGYYGYGWPYFNNYLWWGKRSAGFSPSESDAALQGPQSAVGQ
ncbi:hypothetical protein DdX_02604 [Ditylenchus destructor]|uniref:Uncharacterized protein n=1 Tax=Ditylenchus destructor TaxID=166010 RepID=A0AAD4NHX9_9BILA|nr:hypothetical protein DdX_02604 [Ditylenchus destructor]